MGKTTYLKEKRPDRLPEWIEQDLVFDLINSFVVANTSQEVALLLRDLLTTKEVKNLAKRLRIAKLLLSGKKYEEIVEEIHCSLGTVAKVKIWLEEGGQGLQRIIIRLPKRRKKSTDVGGIPGYRLPQLVLATAKELAYQKQTKRLKDFLDRMAEKGILDRNIREQLAEEFREEKFRKTKRLNR